MKRLLLPFAVVLDLGSAGYGIIRSLSDYGIPVIGFMSSSMFYVVGGTKLCDNIFVFKDFPHLLELLINFSKIQSQKPVLYLTGDIYVNFISENIKVIRQFYQIHFPDSNTIGLLMDKNIFFDFAEKNNIKIPRTIDLRNITEIDDIKGVLNFPVILKPWMRTYNWNKMLKEKAFIAHSFEEFKGIYDKVKLIESNVLVQEYIPGSDDQVYYCLAYYDEGNNCLAAFTGQKLRQWPLRTGSTATTISSDNDTIKNDLLQIFRLINYKGFGSIEYKKHAITGEYYIMEPTVGRADLQEYVATLNGTNIPLIAYNSLTGANIEPIEPDLKPIVYIDEKAELKSVIKLFREGNLSIKDWYKSIRGHRAFRFFNRSDPKVFFLLFYEPFYYFIQRLKSYRSKD